jgi:hypothetical protein
MYAKSPDRYPGYPVKNSVIACAASGPSLTSEDCLRIHDAGVPIIAVNDSWRAAPFCLAVCAGDREWWAVNRRDVPAGARRFSFLQVVAQEFGLEHFRGLAPGSHNSGQRAIELAYILGARRILLVGYDCSLSRGIHWHGPHTGLRNPTPGSVAAWRREYDRTAAALVGVDIINCSRHTELTAFPRGMLEDYL